jgi:hypothetical protein
MRHVLLSQKAWGVSKIGYQWLARPLAILWFVAVLTGCAAFQTGTAYHADSINAVRFRDRSVSKADADVRVTVAVPTKEETQALFDVDLIKKEIQPVWVKIENHSEKTYYLLGTATDPNYFSPLEVVYAMRGGLFGIYRDGMERHFRSVGFQNPVRPNTAVSGFIYTNLDEGEKVVQIDLIASEQVKFFTFLLKIPGIRVDYRMVDFDSLYAEEEIADVEEEELKAALEDLPCCTTDEEGTDFGDPLNLVVIGDFNNITAAFARRGWLPAEETYATAVWKTIKSFFFGSRYRYSPVSPLYFEGRRQDFARQKPRHDIHERNHLRLWYTPLRYQDKPVFIGQISRDIGVRFTSKAWPPVTHKIDPDIDEARGSVVEDLIYSQMLAKVGWVKGVGRARPSKPRVNLTGDPFFTDGYRTVLIIDQGPVALNQIQTFLWEEPETFNIGPSPESQQN